MAGETRQLVFSEGTSVSAPAQVNLVATSIPTFANDAAFESNKGSAGTAGDIYQNTTDGLVHHHDGASWKSVDNIESIQTISGAKTFSSQLTVSDTTNSTNKDTGSIVTEGGLGVEQDANIGGSLTVTGDLTVNGTTTTIDTTTLDVEDANITLNKGGNQASADGISGFTVEMSDATNASLIYDSSLASKFKLGDSVLRELVDVASVQDLTNKSLYDINTIFVNSADTTKQLIMDVSGNTTGNTVTFSTNSASGVDKYNYPSTSGTTVNVLSDTVQATVTNKDYDGSTASDSSRFTLSKDTRTNLDGLTRKQGTIFYDTTNNTIVFDNGAAITEVTGSNNFPSGITTDTIGEFSAAAGVTIDSTLNKDGLTNAGASGSVSTPAYSFVGDEDTGIYRPGTNQLGFATAGTSAGSVNASQNWTIGVNGSGTGSTLATIYGNRIVLQDFDTTNNSGDSVSYLDINDGGGTRMGRVGFLAGDSSLSLVNSLNANLNFLTNNSNRGSISGSGLWSIGATGGTSTHTLYGRWDVDSGQSSNAVAAMRVSKDATGTSGNVFVQFFRDGPSTTINGDIRNTAATTMAFGYTSDRRIKKDIVDLNGSLEKLSKLRPVKYTLKDVNEQCDGFIAQDFIKVFPNLVVATDNGEGEDLPDGVKPWSLSSGEMTGLYPHIIKAIQELKAKVEFLESK